MSSVIDGIKANVNSILGLRDTLGVGLKDVYLVTRTWAGTEIGDGAVTEDREQMLPSPRIVQFNHDLRIVAGGAIEQGDILLKMVSKQTYATKDLIDGVSTSELIEELFEVGGILYRVVEVTEKHVTWNILLRRLSDQTRAE